MTNNLTELLENREKWIDYSIKNKDMNHSEKAQFIKNDYFIIEAQQAEIEYYEKRDARYKEYLQKQNQEIERLRASLNFYKVTEPAVNAEGERLVKQVGRLRVVLHKALYAMTPEVRERFIERYHNGFSGEAELIGTLEQALATDINPNKKDML